jgi:methylmalonyl-CoA/ethylmalonyl-CoA epimerase
MPPQSLQDLLIGIDHIGICVSSMDAAASLWSAFSGLMIAHRECVEPQKTEAAFLDPEPGGATIELVSPLPGNEGLNRFLASRGDGLHHVAFAVTDIRAALARLKAAGIRLIDETPRPGARGHAVAFLHPKAMNGTLVELVERHRSAHQPSLHPPQPSPKGSGGSGG